MMKICLILKKGKSHNQKVINLLKKNKQLSLDIFFSKVGTKIPNKLKKNKYDMIISYLSAWILSDKILNKTKYFNINFHPGPPKYPGIGCFNFALYNNEKYYGVTMHEMSKIVDSGKIIKTKYFPIKKMNLLQLIEKSYESMFSVFKKEIPKILKSKKLIYSKQKWKRKAYTRKNFVELCKLYLNMSPQKIVNKLGAIYHPDFPDPIIKYKNKVFKIKPL
mgnify:FL=1